MIIPGGRGREDVVRTGSPRRAPAAAAVVPGGWWLLRVLAVLAVGYGVLLLVSAQLSDRPVDWLPPLGPVLPGLGPAVAGGRGLGGRVRRAAPGGGHDGGGRGGPPPG